MNKQIHNWDHRIAQEIERLKGNFVKGKPNYRMPSKKDVDLILEFIEDCKSDRLSKARIEFYLRTLRLTCKYMEKDMIDNDIKDIKKCMAKIEGSDKLGEWGKQCYRISMKKFYRWVYNEKFNAKLKDEEYPELVEWINTTMKDENHRLPEEILNEDDVKLLLDNCNNIRDKCLVALLWDSGCRIGEILSLQIKNVTFDKYGAQIIVYGKTGSRRVRLVPSVPYLSNWIENHPKKTDPNTPLFINVGSKDFGNKMSYPALDTMLRKLKIRSGIKKKINAHSFRHGRATYYASRVKESVLKEMFGWTQKSQMAGIYTHLSGRDVDREVLKAQGIVEEEKEVESKLVPKKCPRCNAENGATAKFCNKCSMVLDETIALELQQKEERAEKVFEKVEQNKLSVDKEVLKELLREMIKKGEIKI